MKPFWLWVVRGGLFFLASLGSNVSLQNNYTEITFSVHQGQTGCKKMKEGGVTFVKHGS